MQNSQMILASLKPASSMDSSMFTTTTAMTTTPAANATTNATMSPDMVFNAGHQLSIVVYRFLIKIASLTWTC